jgi:multidrug resistance efflux pump
MTVALSPENKAKRIETLEKRIAVIKDGIAKTRARYESLQADLASAKTDLEWLRIAPVAGQMPPTEAPVDPAGGTEPAFD